MRFAAFALALPLVSGLALVPRATDQSKAVLQNLTTIENDITTLNNTINQNDDNTAYNFFQLNAIQAQSNQIITDVNSTAGTTNSSTVFTAAESKQISDAITGTLEPMIGSLLNNVVAHKPAFDAGGISPTVQTSLQNQREATRELGNALISKADSSYKASASQTSADILAKFDSAIKAYN